MYLITIIDKKRIQDASQLSVEILSKSGSMTN